MCLCLWLCLCLCVCLRLRLRLRCSLPMHAAHFFGNMNLNIQGMNLQALSQVLQGEACSSIACVCMFVDPFASLSLSFLFFSRILTLFVLRSVLQFRVYQAVTPLLQKTLAETTSPSNTTSPTGYVPLYRRNHKDKCRRMGRV